MKQEKLTWESQVIMGNPYYQDMKNMMGGNLQKNAPSK